MSDANTFIMDCARSYTECMDKLEQFANDCDATSLLLFSADVQLPEPKEGPEISSIAWAASLYRMSTNVEDRYNEVCRYLSARAFGNDSDVLSLNAIAEYILTTRTAFQGREYLGNLTDVDVSYFDLEDVGHPLPEDFEYILSTIPTMLSRLDYLNGALGFDDADAVMEPVADESVIDSDDEPTPVKRKTRKSK